MRCSCRSVYNTPYMDICAQILGMIRSHGICQLYQQCRLGINLNLLPFCLKRRSFSFTSCHWLLHTIIYGSNHVEIIKNFIDFFSFFPACPFGRYKKYASPDPCKLCPAHSSHSITGSKDVSDCKCFEGYKGNPGLGIPCKGNNLVILFRCICPCFFYQTLPQRKSLITWVVVIAIKMSCWTLSKLSGHCYCRLQWGRLV